MYWSKALELEIVGGANDSSTDTSVFEHNINTPVLNSVVDVLPLPPTDHGKHAYLVLAGCTFIQAPVWGQHMFRQFAPPY
jgi:hypothetical protein